MRTKGKSSSNRRRQEEMMLDNFLDYFLPEDKSTGRGKRTSRRRELSPDRGLSSERGIDDILGKMVYPSACGGGAYTESVRVRAMAARKYEAAEKGGGEEEEEEENSQFLDSRDDHDTAGNRTGQRSRPRMSRKQRKPSGIMMMRSRDEGEDWAGPDSFRRTNVRDDTLFEEDDERSESSFVVRVRSKDTLVSELTEQVPGVNMRRKASGRSERALADLQSTKRTSARLPPPPPVPRLSYTKDSSASSRQRGEANSRRRESAALAPNLSGLAADDYDEDEICNTPSLGRSPVVPVKQTRNQQIQQRERVEAPRAVEIHVCEKTSHKTSSSTSTEKRGNHDSPKGGNTSVTSSLTSQGRRNNGPLMKGLLACSRGNQLERFAAEQEELSQIVLVYDPTPRGNPSSSFSFDCPKSDGRVALASKPTNSDISSTRKVHRPVSVHVHEPFNSKPALLLGTGKKSQAATNTQDTSSNIKASQASAKLKNAIAGKYAKTGAAGPGQARPTTGSDDDDLPSPSPQAYAGKKNQIKPQSKVNLNLQLWPFSGNGLFTSELDELAPLGRTPNRGRSPRKKPNPSPSAADWKARPRSPSPPSPSKFTRFVSMQETEQGTELMTFPSREESTFFSGFTAPSMLRSTVYDRKRMASRLTYPTFHWQSDDASIGVMSMDYG